MVVRLSLEYFSDDEYQSAFFEFGGLRGDIAKKIHALRAEDNYVILDLLTGHGLLTAELAKCFPKSRIIGTGLASDIASNLRVKESERYPVDTWGTFEYVHCDVARLPFDSACFDIVANFLGLEDVLMTSGMKGLQMLFEELGRVTKSGALIQIAIAEYGETPEERLAKEVWNVIGLNAIFLSRDRYLQFLKKQAIYLESEYVLEIHRKMTANQAREELEFACKDAPHTFSQFGVTAIKFDDLWRRFGSQIEETGMAYWSRIRVMLLSKD